MTVFHGLKRPFLLLILIAGTLPFSCSKDEDEPDPNVTANEEIYINEIYASGDDWIELYNKTTETKDLSGYLIYDDVANKYALPAGTSLPPNGFLVIYCDDQGTGLHSSFKLTSSGETVYLENKSGQVIEKVIFPELQNGQSYGRFPDGTDNFAISGATTQGATNGGNNAPAIASVTREPLVVGMQDEVAVKAEFLSTTGISTVKLYYRINGTGGYTSLDMSLSAGAYTATIPALGGEGKVEYYVEAKNASGASTFSPHNAPEKTHSYLMTDDELPLLVINEFMASNSTCCPDKSSGVDEFDDWIEIYNKSAEPINIAGMYLSDDHANPFNHKIPDSNPALTTIPPGGYLVIWADSDKDQGELHLDFSLSNEGEEIGLYYYDGRAIDELSFQIQTENTSMQRMPDGTGTFTTRPVPTPGFVNQ